MGFEGARIMGVKMTKLEFVQSGDDVVRIIKRAKYDYMAATAQEPQVIVLSWYAYLMLKAYATRLLGYPASGNVKVFDGMKIIVLDDSEELEFTVQFAKEWD